MVGVGLGEKEGKMGFLWILDFFRLRKDMEVVNLVCK